MPVFFTLKFFNMTLKFIDKNEFYFLDVNFCKWSTKNIDCISLELNNMNENVKYKIPNETCFIMSLEDAKMLKAFLNIYL